MNSPGSSSGGSSNNVSGHAAVSGVTAQTRAGEAARAEVLRLQESLRLAVSALQAIGDRARYLSRYSARVRVLELEVIPAGSYLSDRAGLLLGELDVRQVPGRWAAGMAPALDEMRVMLEWAIEVTASVDIPGELGLPLELVSTVQSGARAGMACLDRLRQILEEYDTAAVEHYEPDPRVAVLQPSRPAQWVLRAAGRCYPRRPGTATVRSSPASCSRWPKPKPGQQANSHTPSGRPPRSGRSAAPSRRRRSGGPA